MARKVGQIIARGDPRWLIRVYLDDPKKKGGANRPKEKHSTATQTVRGCSAATRSSGNAIGCRGEASSIGAEKGGDHVLGWAWSIRTPPLMK